MRLFRLYSGSDGQDHPEQIALSFSPRQFAEQSPMQPAAGISFSRMTPGTFVDWHNAPRRQYAIFNKQGATR